MTPNSFCTTCFIMVSTCCVAVAQQETELTADTHQSLAKELVDILSRTEIQLRSCVDEQAVTTAIPQLLELSQRASQLKQRQKALPEPTVQDYMAAQSLVGDFNTIVQAIEQHIARLEREKLLTPELRKILHLPN
ncbi:MAG: hypothetical protein IJ985_04080 [Akkermansia sp.]|nr:hypothetical protein [Akkermansia sp.]MBR1978662.1 hypothetical protein [Akkermansia sp.]